MSQNKRILADLKRGARLTSLTAVSLYGCTRLAARIKDLRDAGHPIQSKMVQRGDKWVAEYRMVSNWRSVGSIARDLVSRHE